MGGLLPIPPQMPLEASLCVAVTLLLAKISYYCVLLCLFFCNTLLFYFKHYIYQEALVSGQKSANQTENQLRRELEEAR